MKFRSEQQWIDHYAQHKTLPGSRSRVVLSIQQVKDAYAKWKSRDSQRMAVTQACAQAHAQTTTCLLYYALSRAGSPYAAALRTRAGSLLHRLEAAHIEPRSLAPDKAQNGDNIVILNKYSHQALDSGLDPVFASYPITHSCKKDIMQACRKKDWAKVTELMRSILS